MPSDHDDSEFVDRDFLESREAAGHGGSAAASGPETGMSDEELIEQASLAQQRLSQLHLEQQEMQQKLSDLEESKRRRHECSVGREEALRDLTRGIALLEKAEFDARANLEQMTRTLEGLRTCIQQVEAIDERNWQKPDWNVQLSRDSASVENARMEWNAARLRWDVLGSSNLLEDADDSGDSKPVKPFTEAQSFTDFCRLGFALTWPVAAAVLIIGGLVVFALLKQ